MHQRVCFNTDRSLGRRLRDWNRASSTEAPRGNYASRCDPSTGQSPSHLRGFIDSIPHLPGFTICNGDPDACTPDPGCASQQTSSRGKTPHTAHQPDGLWRLPHADDGVSLASDESIVSKRIMPIAHEVGRMLVPPSGHPQLDRDREVRCLAKPTSSGWLLLHHCPALFTSLHTMPQRAMASSLPPCSSSSSSIITSLACKLSSSFQILLGKRWPHVRCMQRDVEPNDSPLEQNKQQTCIPLVLRALLMQAAVSSIHVAVHIFFFFPPRCNSGPSWLSLHLHLKLVQCFQISLVQLSHWSTIQRVG